MVNSFYGLPIKAYSKKELARLYAPELTDKAAGKRLCQWIKHCRPLCDALERTGYKPLQRILNPAQVELVFRYLGEP